MYETCTHSVLHQLHSRLGHNTESNISCNLDSDISYWREMSGLRKHDEFKYKTENQSDPKTKPDRQRS